MLKSLFSVRAAIALALVAVAALAPDHVGHVPHFGSAGAAGLAGAAFMGFPLIVNANIPPRMHTAILAVIDPASKNAGAYSTGWLSAAAFEAFQAQLSVGVMGALATVDMKLEQASDATGTGVKDVTGKSITQMVATASPTVDANNRQATIDCRQEELDIANGFAYVRATVTVGVAATILSTAMRGFFPTFGPADTLAAASVAQQV